MNTVLLQLPAPLQDRMPNLASTTNPISLSAPNLALELAIKDLCTKLQDTHVSFLFDGSAPSSLNEVQPLQFPSLSHIPNLDTSDEDEDLAHLETMMKEQLCTKIESLRHQKKQIKKLSSNLIQDCTTLITHSSLLHLENRKQQSGLFKREQKQQTAQEQINPGGKGVVATSQVCLTSIQAIGKEKQDAATRKWGSRGMQGRSTEEEERQSKIWKIAEAEYNEQKAEMKRNGMSLKNAGKKPLLRWFNDTNDPETLLQELRNSNQASSPPAPHQTCQCHEIFISDESIGE